MESVLLLLVIFAAASVLSRFTHASLFVKLLSAPFFLALGYFFSSSYLGFLKTDVLLDANIFVEVSLSWIGFLLGIRRFIFANSFFLLKKIKISLHFIFSVTLLFFVVYTALTNLWFSDFSHDAKLFQVGLCFFLATLLLGRETLFFNPIRINIFVASLFSVVMAIAFWLLIQRHAYSVDTKLLWCPALILGVSVLSFWLLHQSHSMPKEMLSLAFLSIVVFLSGVSTWFYIPHIILGFLFGLAISFFKNPQFSSLFHTLLQTEQPTRIVLMILLGARFDFPPKVIFVGTILGLALGLCKYALHWFFSYLKGINHFHSFFVGSAEICVPFIAAFWFAFPDQKALFNDISVIVICAGGIADVFGVLRWRKLSRMRKVGAKK